MTVIRALTPRVSPIISVGAAWLAAWLVAKANVLGIEGLGQKDLETDVATVITWIAALAVALASRARWQRHVAASAPGAAQAPQSGAAPTPSDPNSTDQGDAGFAAGMEPNDA